MNFIDSSIEIVQQGDSIIDGYKHIEKAARNCYRSEDKINDTSYERMLNVLKDRQHYSPLAHFTVYLTVQRTADLEAYFRMIDRYDYNPYSKVVLTTDCAYVTTNFRVIVENKWHEDLKFVTPASNMHKKRVTVKINCSIGVSREFNRHTTFTVSESSTRYCNYSKDKFGSSITYVIPQWIYDISENLGIYNKGQELVDLLSEQDDRFFEWKCCLADCEETYMYLLEKGCKPQDARSVLPLDTATTVFYTAFVDDWKHFFKLRCSPAAHPDARILAEEIQNEFKKLNYI